MNRRLPSSTLAAACILAGCAAPTVPSATVMRASCNSGPYTVWLDFDGASLVHAATDDATQSPIASLLTTAPVNFPAFDGSIAAPKVTQAQAEQSIVDRVRTNLQPFAIDVVTARPTAPPYSVVLVGGTSATIGAGSDEGGLAEEDCGNLRDGDVSFVFAGELSPDFGGVVAIGNTTLHEVGHTFGLLHTVAPADLMYSVASPMLTLPSLFALHYGTGDYSSYSAGVSMPVPRPCAGNDPVDNAALMTCNAGGRAPMGDVTPPSLTWIVPVPNDMTAVITAPLTVSFSASDDTGVTRLEVFKNLELVAVLTAPPYTTTIEASAGETFFVTVEAIDAAANRATLSREFTVAAAADLGHAPGDLSRASTSGKGCGVGGFGSDGSGGAIMLGLLFVMTNSFCARRRSRRRNG